MRVRPAALTVVLTLVLAGCGGSMGSIGIAEQTPTPVEAHVAAPGVTADGIEDPARLAGAHRASLRDRSYTVRAVTVFEWDDGTRGRIQETVRVARDGERVYEATFDGDLPKSIMISGFFDRPERRFGWTDGNHSYLLEIRGTDRTIFSGSSVLPVFRVFEAERFLQRFFAPATAVSVGRVEYDGRIAYRIDAVTPGNASDRDDDVRAVAVIDSFGLVHSVRVSGAAGLSTTFREPRRMNITIRYTAIGNTTVERPGWVDDVEQELEAMNGTRSEGDL